MNIYRVMTRNQETHFARRVNSEYHAVEGSLSEGFRSTDRVLDVAELKPPVDPENIYGIGLNYRKHIEEGGRDVPEEPQIFFKATTSVIGHGDEVVLPDPAPDYVDYEAELAVVIGDKARRVDPDDAGDVIAGYTIANDVSARDCQEHDLQWVRAKSFDTFCPLGPCLSTEPPEGTIEGRLNGELKQKASFDDMVFSPEEIVSYLSRQFTLLPGTVVLTGTPSGVGFAQNPPRYLEAGDEYEVSIPGIGRLRNEVIDSNGD